MHMKLTSLKVAIASKSILSHITANIFHEIISNRYYMYPLAASSHALLVQFCVDSGCSRINKPENLRNFLKNSYNFQMFVFEESFQSL